MFKNTVLALGIIFSLFSNISQAAKFDKAKLLALKGTLGTQYSVDLRTLLTAPPTGTLTFYFNVIASTPLPPAFLTIEGNTLKSKGVLNDKNTFKFLLSVKEETGGSEPQVDLDVDAILTVLPPPPQFTGPIDLKTQLEGKNWTADLHDYLTPGSQVTSFSATGLPEWMKLNKTTGKLSGKPDRKDVGDYSGIEITAIGEGGSAVAPAFGTVLINLIPAKWTADLFDLGEILEGVAFEKKTSDLVLNPENFDLTYSIVSMTPPPWMEIGPKTGTLFGTPTKPGKVDVIVAFSYEINGGVKTEATTFTVNVKHVNHAPYWLAHPLPIAKKAFSGVAYSVRLDSSAVDPDGDKLTYHLISGPAWGKVNVNTGELSGTPAKSDVPKANTFVVEVRDPEGLSDRTDVQITVEKSNEPPTWNSHPVILQPNAKEDQLYQVNLQNYASDPDGDPITFTVISGPSWVQVTPGGILSGRPGKNEANKLHELQITVSDNISTPNDTAKVAFFVDHVNHPPVWAANPIESETKEDDHYSINLKLYVTDEDLNEVLTFGTLSGPTWAKINPATGILEGTPTHANEGKNEWMIRVQDSGGEMADTRLVVNVLHRNHAPKWNPPIVINAKEETQLSVSLVPYVTDIDLPNDALQFVKVSTTPSWISVSEDGTVSGTPARKDVGTTSFEVRVLDIAKASDVTSIKVVVEPINHAPYWRPIQLTDADEDINYKGNLKPFAVDLDGDELKFSLVTGPAWMFVGEDGSITGVPTAADVGKQSARFKVTDTGGLSAEADAEILVNHTNHPPVVSVDLPVFEVKERETLEVDLKQWIKDLDGDALLCTMLSPVEPWVTLNSDCTVVANPTRKQVGDHAYDFKVSDKSLFTAAVLKIKVLKNPRNPIWLSEPITPQPLEAKTNIAFSANILDRAKDLDGEALTISMVSGPDWLGVSPQGDLSGTPKEKDLGDQTAILKVCNTDLLCNTDGGTLLLTVKPGLTVDVTQIDTAVPGAPAEYLWDVDNSRYCDTTIRSLKNNIQHFYNTLNAAQIHHSGLYLSADVERFKAIPIKGKNTATLMTWNDGDQSANIWRRKTDLAFADDFCHSCTSSPIWAMYRFLEILPTDPNLSQLYHKDYFLPKVPMDTMFVSHQVDHYKHYTRKVPAVKDYTPDDFARDFILLHRQEEKSLRVSVIAPECGNAGSALVANGDPNTYGPSNAYKIIQSKTGGTYYPTNCQFDAKGALTDFAQKIIFRAYVHAKTRTKLSKVPLTLTGMKVTIGGVVIPGGTGGVDDQWSYDASSNEVIIKWHLIDEGQLKPGDKLEIEYRVS